MEIIYEPLNKVSYSIFLLITEYVNVPIGIHQAKVSKAVPSKIKSMGSFLKTL